MPNLYDTSDLAINVAAENLGRLWCHQSRFQAEQVGFGFVLRPDAPNGLDELREAWEISQITKQALPISSLYNDSSIYDDPLTNGTFRHVHDVMHMVTGLTFTSDDELELASLHLEAVRGVGFGPDSLEHRVAHGDMVGMIMALRINKRYPMDQKMFVVNCVRYGVGEAVDMERAAR